MDQGSTATTYLLSDTQAPVPQAQATASVGAPQAQAQAYPAQAMATATPTATATTTATTAGTVLPQATAYPAQAGGGVQAPVYPAQAQAQATAVGGVPQQEYATVGGSAGGGGGGGAAPPAMAEALPVVGDGTEINTFEDKNSMHIRSLVLSIVLWVALIIFIAAAAAGSAFFSSAAPTPPSYYGSGYYYSHYGHYYGSSGSSCSAYSVPFLCGASYLFPVFAGLYFLESFVMVCDSCVKCKLGSSTCRYVSNIKSDSSSERFIAQLHREDPQFRMYVECYHFETRSRRVSYTDGNGNTRYRTEYYQEKVITHRATGWIQYDHWMDCSTSVCGLGIHPLVKLELSKSYQYADDQTAQEFDRQRVNFRAANDFDVHQSYSESYIIRGYEQYALCCRHGVKPCFLGFGGYFLATILLMTWAYRRWVEVMCLSSRIRIRKRVSCSPAPVFLMPLVGAFGQQRDLVLTEAIVYQQMYNTPFPAASVEVQNLANQAIAVSVPQATYAGAEVVVAK